MREIILYTLKDGSCPVKNFLDSLSHKAFQKISWVLRLISEVKNIPATYLKKLKGTEEIWECRIKFGSNIYRLFCFLSNGRVIVLTHGIIKKSQKIPPKEIKRAKEYRKNYLRRKK